MRNCAVLLAMLSMLAIAIPASADTCNTTSGFCITFDENGNATVNNLGTIYNETGIVGTDQNGNTGLIYALPEFINPGAVAVNSPTGTISDAMNFFDVGTNGYMAFFSNDADGDLADTGVPLAYTSFVGATEDSNGNFVYNVGNQYFGNSNDPSPVPEPSSLIMMGSGLFGLMTMVRRRFGK